MQELAQPVRAHTQTCLSQMIHNGGVACFESPGRAFHFTTRRGPHTHTHPGADLLHHPAAQGRGEYARGGGTFLAGYVRHEAPNSEYTWRVSLVSMSD